jgi:hypothetical protein
VSVRDKEGGVVFSGRTDARGEVRDILVIDTRYRQETSDPNRIATDHQGPFTANIRAGGGTAFREIAPDAQGRLAIDLPLAGR